MYTAPKNENDPKAWSKVSTSIAALIAAQKKKKDLNLNAEQAVWQLAEWYGLEGNKPATPSPPFNQNLSAIWLPYPPQGHSLYTILPWKGSRYQRCHPYHHLWDPLGHPDPAASTRQSLLRATQVLRAAALAVLYFSLKYALDFLHQN